MNKEFISLIYRRLLLPWSKIKKIHKALKLPNKIGQERFSSRIFYHTNENQTTTQWVLNLKKIQIKNGVGANVTSKSLKLIHNARREVFPFSTGYNNKENLSLLSYCAFEFTQIFNNCTVFHFHCSFFRQTNMIYCHETLTLSVKWIIVNKNHSNKIWEIKCYTVRNHFNFNHMKKHFLIDSKYL